MLAKPGTGVSVVIPCLNEEASIGLVVEAARKGIVRLNLPCEVIVVDNGSTDNSASIAAGSGAIVVSERRSGYGAALRRGFSAARFEILVMADGDMSYDLTRIDEIVTPILLDHADFVIGNRLNGVRDGAMPRLHRHLGNPALSFLVRMMFSGHAITDSQCGLRAIRKTAYEKLECMTMGMEFATEMIVKATHADMRISQVDIEYHPRVGKSKLRPLQDGWRHLRFILLYIPLGVLVLVPLIFWILTLAAMTAFIAGPVSIGDHRMNITGMMLCSMLNVASFQLIIGAVLVRAYAHLNGFRRDPLVAWLYNHLKFRAGSLASAVFAGCGVIAVGSIVAMWLLHSDRSAVATKLLILGLWSLVSGIQLWVTSYMVSIMALPRHMDSVRDE